MDTRYIPIVEDAVKNYRKKEGFESALARAVKKSGRRYEVYIRIVTEIREYAYSNDIPLVDAAKKVIKMAMEMEEKVESFSEMPYKKV